MAGSTLAALNLFSALLGSPWLKRAGWLSSLAQFAAGIALFVVLGMPGLPRDFSGLCRVGLVIGPIFEILVTGLFLYDRRDGSKIPVDQLPE